MVAFHDISGSLWEAFVWFASHVTWCINGTGLLAFGEQRWNTIKLFVWGGLTVSMLFLFAGLMATCKMFCDVICFPFWLLFRPWIWGWKCCKLGYAAFSRIPMIPRRDPTTGDTSNVPDATSLIFHGPEGVLPVGREYWEGIRGRGGGFGP